MTDTPAPQTALAEALDAARNLLFVSGQSRDVSEARGRLDDALRDWDAVSERYTIVASDRLVAMEEAAAGLADVLVYEPGSALGGKIALVYAALPRSEAAEKGARG